MTADSKISSLFIADLGAEIVATRRMLGVPVPGMYGPSADDRPAS